MIHLNPFAISNLSILAFNLPFTILLAYKIENRTHFIYFLSVICINLWAAGALLGSSSTDPSFALKALQVAYCGAIFIPILIAHTISKITQTRHPSTLLILFYLQGIFFVAATLTNKMFILKYVFNSFYYYSGNSLFFISMLWWITLIFFIQSKLFKSCKDTNWKDKRVLYFFIANTVGFGGGIGNYLPTFNIDIYPYGNFLVSFYSLVTSYAIFQHQLLDIKVTVKKGLVYSILLASISIFYSITVFVFERLTRGALGYSSLSLSILAAFLLGIAFMPLRNIIQSWVNRIFSKKSIAEVEEENMRLRNEIIESEKLKTIATLASGVAHEIKNPLTAINTFAEQLPKRLDDKEFLKKFSKIVGNEVGRINNLVHELLDFAKPSPPQLKSTNIYKLLDETVELMSSAFLKYNIKINKGYGGIKNQVIAIDPQQFRQALMNIYLNAIEAMPQGGILTVGANIQGIGDGGQGLEKISFPATPSPLNPNPYLTIFIRDTGVGISTKDIPHIFDPFFTTKDHGTGLGLSVTYSIIEKHGGKIYVSSTVGQGTEFTIELPLTIAPSHTTPLPQ